MNSSNSCKTKARDCAAYSACGRCRALESTDFSKPVCPFYKSRKQSAEECAAAAARLKKAGKYKHYRRIYGI